MWGHFLDGLGSDGCRGQEAKFTKSTKTRLQSLDKVAEKIPALKANLGDIKLAGLIFPFKASPYYVEELVDWEAEDVRDDPFYRLIFPTMDMLIPEHQKMLRDAKEAGDPLKLLSAAWATA